MNTLKRILPVATLVAVVALVLIIPFLGLSGYWMRLLSTVGMGIALAQGMNLIVGYAGYAALGNLSFFGVGSYVAALTMTKLHWPFLLAMVAAAAVAAMYAAIIGLPVLRLRGAYFAIATIGINEFTRELVLNLHDFTGGAQGVTMPFYDGGLPEQERFFYFLMMGLGALATALVWWVSKSRLGYALRALKADEEGARVMGIRTTGVKTVAWAISAAITGATGAAYAFWLSFIEPTSVFDIVTSVKYYIIAILGGVGSVFGPVVGAAAFELLSEYIWSKFLSLHMLVLGGVIVLVALFMPGGVAGLFRRSRSRKAAERGKA